MNQIHLQFCASPEWAAFVEAELLPWALDGAAFGARVLEVGAGPGLTTDVLRRKVAHLTAVEVDRDLADALRTRLAGTNVDVVHADGTALPFESAQFDTATCFTMLHHVPTPALQDQLLAQVQRVLKPGGLLVGTDSTASPGLAEFHDGDVYTPIDPAGWPGRLEAAGFTDVLVEEAEERFRFLGRATGNA